MVRFLRIGWLAVLAWGMLLTSAGAVWAMQPTVVQIEKNADGTSPYHFTITIDNAVTVESGTAAPNPDFFTIFNFDGFVPDSATSPEGWRFSTSTNGVTPLRGGKALVNPEDVEGIPNLTWSRTGAQGASGDDRLLSSQQDGGYDGRRVRSAGDADAGHAQSQGSQGSQGSPDRLHHHARMKEVETGGRSCGMSSRQVAPHCPAHFLRTCSVA